jgi:hypothetical protein
MRWLLVVAVLVLAGMMYRQQTHAMAIQRRRKEMRQCNNRPWFVAYSGQDWSNVAQLFANSRCPTQVYVGVAALDGAGIAEQLRLAQQPPELAANVRIWPTKSVTAEQIANELHRGEPYVVLLNSEALAWFQYWDEELTATVTAVRGLLSWHLPTEILYGQGGGVRPATELGDCVAGTAHRVMAEAEMQNIYTPDWSVFIRNDVR